MGNSTARQIRRALEIAEDLVGFNSAESTRIEKLIDILKDTQKRKPRKPPEYCPPKVFDAITFEDGVLKKKGDRDGPPKA